MIPVRVEIDVFSARDAVRQLATRLGFPLSEVEELVIVTSELAWNIVKHTPGGLIAAEPIVDENGGVGIRVLAKDDGKPFTDFEMALQDGFQDGTAIEPEALLTRRGIGSGLGAIARLTDRYSYRPLAMGKEIEVVRFLKRQRAT